MASNLLEKGLDIFIKVARAKSPLTVADLADQLDMPVSTVYRIISVLKKKGWVEKKTRDGHLIVGKRILAISRIVNEQDIVVRIAYPEMKKLLEATNLSVTLSGIMENRMVCLESIESNTALRITTAKGVISPLHAGAPGKVLLAFQPKIKRDRILKTAPLTPFTQNTITDPVKMAEELKLVRKNGVAFSRSEMLEGAEGLSAPLFDGAKKIVAAISIAGPEQQMRKMNRDDLVDLLKTSAKIISDNLP